VHAVNGNPFKKRGLFAKEYRRGVINRRKDEKERRDAKDFQ